MARRTFIDTANAARLLPKVAGLDLGSGVETASGTVTLDATGEPIREFYTTGTTTFSANGTTVQVGAFTAVVWKRDGSNTWSWQQVVDGWQTPTPTPDTQAPTAGTLAVAVTDTTATLTVSGATDDRGVTGYAFQVNGGAWSSWQTSPTYTATGLTPSASYQFRHKVRDAAGNETQGTAVSETTADEVSMTYTEAVLMDAPLHFLPLDDATGATTAQNLGTAGQPWTVGADVAFKDVTLGNMTRGAHLTTQNAAITAPALGVLAGAEAWTIEAVIRRDGGSTRQSLLSSSRSTWGVVFNNNTPLGYHSTSFARLDDVLPGTTAHICATFDGQTLAMYLNGRRYPTPGSASGPVPDEVVLPAIGKADDPGMLAHVAGVAIYRGVALPKERITAHAKSAGLA